KTVWARDLVGASTTTFETSTELVAFRGSIVVLRNGEVLIARQTAVRHYSAAGVLLHTYAQANINAITPGLTDTSFWLTYNSAAPSGYTAREITIATGADVHNFALPNTGYNWGGPFSVVRQT